MSDTDSDLGSTPDTGIADVHNHTPDETLRIELHSDGIVFPNGNSTLTVHRDDVILFNSHDDFPWNFSYDDSDIYFLDGDHKRLAPNITIQPNTSLVIILRHNTINSTKHVTYNIWSAASQCKRDPTDMDIQIDPGSLKRDS